MLKCSISHHVAYIFSLSFRDFCTRTSFPFAVLIMRSLFPLFLSDALGIIPKKNTSMLVLCSFSDCLVVNQSSQAYSSMGSKKALWDTDNSWLTILHLCDLTYF